MGRLGAALHRLSAGASRAGDAKAGAARVGATSRHRWPESSVRHLALDSGRPNIELARAGSAFWALSENRTSPTRKRASHTRPTRKRGRSAHDSESISPPPSLALRVVSRTVVNWRSLAHSFLNHGPRLGVKRLCPGGLPVYTLTIGTRLARTLRRLRAAAKLP